MSCRMRSSSDCGRRCDQQGSSSRRASRSFEVTGTLSLTERILYPINFNRLRQHDAHDIEPGPLQLDFGAAEVILGGAADVVAFLNIDGAVGFAKIGGGAGFDFDEHEGLAVPRHDIDFTGAAGGTVVARDYGAAVGPQVAMREIFAEAAVVAAECAAAEGVGGAV